MPPEGKRKTMTKKPIPAKPTEIIDGYTIKYHANGKTRWSKGKIVNGMTEGYWEWYRPDGTLKRSGYFEKGEPVGEWVTYDQSGNVHKITTKKAVSTATSGEGVYCPEETAGSGSQKE